MNGSLHASVSLRPSTWMSALCAVMIAATTAGAEAPRYLGPCMLVASKGARTLYVACADARQIAFVDVHSGKVTRQIGVPGEPTGITLSPDGTKLYVTCAGPRSTVLAIDATSGKVLATIPAGHTALGPAVTPDGKRLYVCNRFDNDVSVIDLSAGKEVARVPAVREPVAAAVTPDGNTVVVINHLPADRADAFYTTGVVTVIDTATNRPSAIRLANGTTGLRGVCVAPDGDYAFITHIRSNYELSTSQIENGWMNSNMLSVIDLAERKLLNTVALDEVESAAANPWGVSCTADGRTICVAHAGTAELSLIDTAGLLTKLRAVPTHAEDGKVADPNVDDDRTELRDYFRRRLAALRAGKDGYGDHDQDYYTAGTAAGVPDDFSFLGGLRRRIKLPGRGPRGLAVAGLKVYAAEYFADTVAVVDLQPGAGKPPRTIALGPKPQLTERRRGQMLFNDGMICYQHWHSCASCHPDGRSDGLNWDLMNDGAGNPKNTKSMLLAHQTPPAMITAVRPSAEAAVRSGLEHILFADRPEEDAAAIDAYLKSLRPLPSPYLVDGRLNSAARRGKRLFQSRQVGCARCHPAPLYTDLLKHDVGTQDYYDLRAKFDTPTLIEVWRTAPYMHDGRHTTIKELIAEGKHGDVSKLSPQQIDDLVEFVLSL